MRIGLSFINQIEAMPLPSPDSQAIARRTYEDRAEHAGGGWLAKQIKAMVASITASYHAEHNENDTHSTIHATGAIFERNRTTAIGEAILITYSANNFVSGTAGSTWTVAAGTPSSGVARVFQYTLVGRHMLVDWYIEGSTLATAVAARLDLKIPGPAVIIPTVQQFSQFAYDDNGTLGTGTAQVGPGLQNTIQLYKDLRGTATWSVSTNLSMAGHIWFQINSGV